MPYRSLKTLRVVLAVAFFCATAALFLDYREIGVRGIAAEVLYLQFVPSFLSFLQGMTLAAAGFLVVLAITLLFGRVYCSTICPLGTLQDAVSRIMVPGRSRKRRTYAFSSPYPVIRYGILLLTVAGLVAGSGLGLTLLDPFSNFGRIMSNLVRPVLLAVNNAAAPVAELLGSHALYRVRWPAMSPAAVGAAMAILVLTGWLAARNGRLYCNTVCPVGTLLGLFSRLSLVRIGFDHAACSSCGRCERACKAGCVDFRNRTIDHSRCVSCYNCLTVCPDNALHLDMRLGNHSGKHRKPYRTARKATENTSSKGMKTMSATGRRTVLLGLGSGMLAACGLKLFPLRALAALPPGFVQSRPTVIPESKTTAVSPPGSRSLEHFTSRCTACHLCVSACPSRVLEPSFLEYGPLGMLQPHMAFAEAHCNYDCTICSEICPTGAIEPLTQEEKRRTQTGVAQFIKKNCVVYTDNTNCGACSEHCPTKAVHMVPYHNESGRRLVIPEVNQSLCVGCGGCEHACPTRPYRAIYVDGNPVHKQAEKPVVKALEQPVDEEDFPF